MKLYPSRDGLVRTVDVTYQNHNEKVKRVTTRGVRELVVIHPVEDLGISKELHLASMSSETTECLCYSPVQTLS